MSKIPSHAPVQLRTNFVLLVPLTLAGAAKYPFKKLQKKSKAEPALHVRKYFPGKKFLTFFGISN
jgi:hypothetical protein